MITNRLTKLFTVLVTVMMLITVTRMSVFAEDSTATDQKQQAAGSYSNYTVEFSYNDIEYVMKGDTSVALSEILQKVGLSGKIVAKSKGSCKLYVIASNGVRKTIKVTVK